MGSHRSHNVIFAVSFLIITSVQVPSFFPPQALFFFFRGGEGGLFLMCEHVHMCDRAYEYTQLEVFFSN